MAAITEYIITADSIYADLYDFVDRFEDEVELVTEAKCMLINYGYLEDMLLSKGTASFIERSEGYHASYNGLHLYLEVKDRMITDYIIE